MTSKHINEHNNKRLRSALRPGIQISDIEYIKIKKSDGFNLHNHNDHLNFNAIKILITEINKAYIRVKCECPVGITHYIHNISNPTLGDNKRTENPDIMRDHQKLDITRYVGQAIHIYPNNRYPMSEITEDLDNNGIVVQLLRNKINSVRVTLNASDKWDVKRCEIDNRDTFDDKGNFYLNFVKVSENELEAKVFDNLVRLAGRDVKDKD